MKEIFPSSNSKKSNLSPNEQAITNQQYADLVRRTNEAVCCATAACQCVSDFNSNPNLNKAGVITATSICGTTQVASNLVYSNYATVNCRLCASNIDIDGTHHIRPNELSLAGITSDECISTIQGVDFQNGQASASFISADDARITDIEIENKACISCANIYRGNICNVNITTADVTTLGAECGLVCNLDVTNLNADTLSANCFTPSSIDTEEITAETADFQNITHLSNPQYITQELADTGDYWILLPIFTNGNFFIQANNDDEKMLWSTEITNSLKNIQIRWSQDAYNYIKDFKIAEDARGASVLQIHANLNNETAKLYHQSISTSNTNQLAIYSTDQLPDAEAFNVNKLTGTWIQDIIFTNTLNVKNLEMDNVAVDCVSICKELRLPNGYDYSNPENPEPILCKGELNQYVQNKCQDLGVVPTWVTPAPIVETSCTDLMMSCDIAKYDGSAKTANCRNQEISYCSAMRFNWCCEYDYEAGIQCIIVPNTVCIMEIGTCVPVSYGIFQRNVYAGCANLCWYSAENCELNVPFRIFGSDYYYCFYQEYYSCSYPIIHLGGDNVNCHSCVHGFLDVSRNLCVCGCCNRLSGETTVTTLYASNGRLASRYCENSRCLSNWSGDWKIGNASTGGYVAPIDCLYDASNNNPIIWDGAVKTLKRSDKIELNCADIENLSVHGDLYVDGTMHVDDVETVETTGNFLMTRTNCNSGLSANETSGIVVNNYDGCDKPIAVVSDCTGTVRVGEAQKTETSYSTAIYNKSTDTWTDGTWATITPTGVLTKWDSKSEDGNYITYTNAVFTDISVGNVTNLQPILTRNEANAMTDTGLMKWDATNSRAVTIDAPTCDEQVLTACICGSRTYRAGLICRADGCIACMCSPGTVVPSDCTYQLSPYGIQTCNKVKVLDLACVAGCSMFPEWANCKYIYFCYDAQCNYYELSRIGYTMSGSTECPYIGALNLNQKTGRVLYRDSSCPYYDIWTEMYYATNLCFGAYYVTTPTTTGYCWQDKQAGNYTFASMACYEAYAATHNIPENSTINIENEETYLKVEEEF